MNNNLIGLLLDFLDRSPTPFHAVENMTTVLDKAGFERLDETDTWSLETNRRYYTVKGDSSIVAFSNPGKELKSTGIRMVGAHTDSPCLKVKPEPAICGKGYYQIGVEVYGGALLNPWFDRDLSLAGRVTYVDAAGKIRSTLIDYREPIAVIPSLAIHLDREANKNRTVNPQLHLPAILYCHDGDDSPDFRSLLTEKTCELNPDCNSVLDFDLCFYDSQAPQVIGLNHEFVASARLDNLISCFAGLHALIDSHSEVPTLLVCNDHEEVGSQSAIGAQGPLLKSVLQRWCGSSEAFQQTIGHSMLVSADNAHGQHPNYSDRHDQNHGPRLNKGPVIKVNNNQRYATNSVTSAVYRRLCEIEDIPLQSFVSRTDLSCGTTIGPLTSGEIGVQTLDLGIPQLAMHSTRELCGVKDVDWLCRSLAAFYRLESLI